MSFYDFAVPAYLQMLGSMSNALTKAEAYAAAKKIAPATLLGARLFPDMLPLSRQVQLACDFATRGAARLAGTALTSTPDNETSFEELRARIAAAIAALKAYTPAQFDDAATRSITFPTGPETTATLPGQQFLTNVSLPNFYFHVTTAHGILRMNGVEIGKHDFLGVS